MIALQLDFRLLQPTLLTTPGGDPNREVSLDYLPGSQIRGWVIGCWRGAGQPFDRGLFLSGGTRFLPGYPVLPTGERALPTPRSWMVEKSVNPDERRVVDLACTEPPAAQVQSAGRWQAQVAGQWHQPEPLGEVFVSTARDPRQGRATAASGEVFQVEALAAGQRFRAFVLCDDEATADRLEPILTAQTTAALGGDRQAHYGQAEVTCQRVVDLVEWPAAAGGGDDDEFDADPSVVRVVLLSPAVVRAAHGQSSADPADLVSAVARALKCQATLIQGFVAVEWSGGFNRTWGLPLPQEWTFSAGTTLLLQLDSPACPAARTALLARGLGERRAEGFGRLALDPPTAEGERLTTPPPRPQNEAAALAGPAAKLANRMLQRLRDQRLDLAVATCAQAVLNDQRNRLRPLTKNQLHRLRDEIQTWLAEPAEALTRLQEYGDSVRARSSTRRLFERAQIAGQPPLAWIRSLLTPAELWRQLGDKERFQVALGGVTLRPDDNLARRTALRLVDRVVQLIAKTKGEA